jgi:hypothetical protein
MLQVLAASDGLVRVGGCESCCSCVLGVTFIATSKGIGVVVMLLSKAPWYGGVQYLITLGIVKFCTVVLDGLVFATASETLESGNAIST